MLGENIKRFRKQRGLTQEELAIRLHVVRQTISKWEKNLSVPDAGMLQDLADVLETSVNELLGADIKTDTSRNELADQLARINEQLAVKNRRSKRIWTVVAIVLVLSIIVPAISISLGMATFKHHTFSTSISLSDENPAYTEDEVNAAFDVVAEYFKHNFRGSTLQTLSYDEDYSLSKSEGWAKQYPDEEVIVLLSDFTTDGKGGNGKFNPDSAYHGWEWILTRADGGDWVIRTSK